MSRIPNEGLKRHTLWCFKWHSYRLNEQNPERGIETLLLPPHTTVSPSLNEQNPERGIETCLEKSFVVNVTASLNEQNPERGIETRLYANYHAGRQPV